MFLGWTIGIKTILLSRISNKRNSKGFIMNENQKQR